MNDEPTRTPSFPELSAVAALVLLTVTAATVVWRGETANKKPSERPSIPAVLARIDAAKAQYAADRRLSKHVWLTLSALQESGYLTGPGELPRGVHFVPGKVGENATYHFADGPHKDHPAPLR